ncbi:2-phospho-L-lactate guanylyltransferase [Catenulispora yoronensis]|uniref:Phosphoenolpyruvate guanylyltransferase n=1 Tax=Catenulispora yoronensis TaxID=450799 RepID=A0ABP5F3Z4_9ACTN
MPRSAPSDPSEATRWCLVVPVKRLGHAKSRLGGPRVPPALREQLALAFATDAVSAALSAQRVTAVLVVTDDPTAGAVLGALGAIVVPDEPDAGLNAAFAFGARTARAKLGTDIGVAASAADLPALRSGELDIALGRIVDKLHEIDEGDITLTRHHNKRFFVPDAHDIGTTMLFAPPGVELAPRFGGPSKTAHSASGAIELTGPDISSLRRDVDTAEDLAAALLLGVGPATAMVWSQRDGSGAGPGV